MTALRVALACAALASAPARAARAADGPAQPIRFSHQIHATQATVGCTACHAYAERGPVAGIPSMQRCLGCHKFVKEDPTNAKLDAELKALVKRLREPTPIEWVRVHRLPDHVYFTHQAHVRAGLRCQECHGEVQTMDVVHQVAPLTMGWCLSCHHRKQREQPGRERLTECVTCHK